MTMVPPVLPALMVALLLGGLAGPVVGRLSGMVSTFRLRVTLVAGQGTLALWAWAVLPGDAVWRSCALAWGLLLLATVDSIDLRLPDVLTLPLLVAGLAVGRGDLGAGLPGAVLSASAAYLAFTGLARAYRRWRGVDGLGQGDAKLLAVAGAWLGWQALPSVVLGACLVTLAAVLPGRLAAWVLRRKGIGERPVPFGPGLCLGIWVVWLYGPSSL